MKSNFLPPSFEARAEDGVRVSATGSTVVSGPAQVSDSRLAYATSRLARLPEGARHKFELLHEQLADISTLSQAANDERNAANDEIQRRRQAFDKLTNPRTASAYGIRPVPKDHRSAKHEAEALASAEKRYQRVAEKIDALAHRRSQLAPLVQAMEGFISGLPDGAEVSDCSVEPPKLKRGETWQQRVEAHRKELAGLDANAHTINSAPWPLANVRERIRSSVDRQAERAMPELFRLFDEPDAQLQFSERQARTKVEGTTPISTPSGVVFSNGLAHVSVPDTVGLLCWLFRDQVLDRLNTEAEALADETNALDGIEREKRLAEIAGKRLTVERLEEGCICAAEAEGQQIVRRPDESPEAALQIEVTAQK